jgi:BON domain
MKSDAELREDVLRELAWDPQVTDPDAIAVAVKDGAVTLTGRVPAYAESLAAVRAAGRVAGVRAVADELRVQLSGQPRDDSDIARAIAHVLKWNTQVPEETGTGHGPGGLGHPGGRGRVRLPAPGSREGGPARPRRDRHHQ